MFIPVNASVKMVQKKWRFSYVAFEVFSLPLTVVTHRHKLATSIEHFTGSCKEFRVAIVWVKLKEH